MITPIKIEVYVPCAGRLFWSLWRYFQKG